MKTKNIEFICWFGGHQRLVKAKDLSNLFDKMSKKRKEIWNHISFINSDGNLIRIDKEWIEGGWTFQDCIEDSVIHLDENDKEDHLNELSLLKKIFG